MAEKKSTKKVEPAKLADSTDKKKQPKPSRSKAAKLLAEKKEKDAEEKPKKTKAKKDPGNTGLPPAEEAAKKVVKKKAPTKKKAEEPDELDEDEAGYTTELRSSRGPGRISNRDRIKQDYQDEQQLIIIADIYDELKKRIKKSKTSELNALLSTLLRDRVRQDNEEDDTRIVSMEMMATFFLKRHKQAKAAAELSKDNGEAEMAKHSKRKD